MFPENVNYLLTPYVGSEKTIASGTCEVTGIGHGKFAGQANATHEQILSVANQLRAGRSDANPVHEQILSAAYSNRKFSSSTQFIGESIFSSGIGSGSFEIYDEGILVKRSPSSLNFIGAAVAASIGSPDVEINVTGGVGAGAGTTTILSVTGFIAANTTFNVTGSGTNYTKSGDDGDLLTTADFFNNDETIEINVNGAYAQKSVQAIWLSQTTFRLSTDVYDGDTIVIISKDVMPDNTSILTVSGYIPANTALSVTASGVNYTHTGDAGELGSDVTTFNNTESIEVYVNGMYAEKGTDTVWQSSTTLFINMDLYDKDVIVILS